jgi:hypothetical protein
MSTLTAEQIEAITAKIAGMANIPSGVGTEEAACSVAAINLALDGRLTDKIPACMSPAIGRWMIGVQDAMPTEMRNSAAWRNLIPLAAGTGRDHEAARLAIIMDWMWGTVLPQLQGIADAGGFGVEWQCMCKTRTAWAAWAAVAAAWAAVAAARAAMAAAWAAMATGAAEAAGAARAAVAAVAAAEAAFWATVNPTDLLARLIAVSE